jgi:hypothetical protein
MFHTHTHTNITWDCDTTRYDFFLFEVMEWLYHMQTLSADSPLYAAAFRRALMALRHDTYFKTLSVWMRFISCSPIKFQ